METYRYLCIHRPPAPGAVPHGVTSVDYTEYDRDDYGGHWVHVFGAVEYNHPLSDKEVENYELMEAD